MSISSVMYSFVVRFEFIQIGNKLLVKDDDFLGDNVVRWDRGGDEV